MTHRFRSLRVSCLVCGAAALFSAACHQAGGSLAGKPVPVYDPGTGRLTELLSDRNGDGKPDVHAFMDGGRVLRIEVDRNADGRPDRWEYYGPPTPGEAPNTPAPIVRAEQSEGGAGQITRREFYLNGVIDRVEEDVDRDGRIDKWEQYTGGELRRVDLDVQGKGFPDRRLVYGASHSVERIEQDPDGDGTFTPLMLAGSAK